jgi:hypothetical protein
MECSKCPKLLWPNNPRIKKNYCMKNPQKPRRIFNLVGCNIDGYIGNMWVGFPRSRTQV